MAGMSRLLIAIVAILLLGQAEPARAQKAAFQSVDVYRIVGEIRAAEGHPVAVLLYGSECPLSKAMFPGFVQAARDFEPRGVRFLVFNTDGVEYGDYAVEFLRRNQAGFPPWWCATGSRASSAAR
jgi:thiol-disulfide isomerase/thioredoxin